MPIAKILLVAEIVVSSPETAAAECQRRLDQFREAVQPSEEYGVTLYQATKEHIDSFAEVVALSPPRVLVISVGPAEAAG